MRNLFPLKSPFMITLLKKKISLSWNRIWNFYLDFHKKKKSKLMNEWDSSVPLHLKLWSPGLSSHHVTWRIAQLIDVPSLSFIKKIRPCRLAFIVCLKKEYFIPKRVALNRLSYRLSLWSLNAWDVLKQFLRDEYFQNIGITFHFFKFAAYVT